MNKIKWFVVKFALSVLLVVSGCSELDWEQPQDLEGLLQTYVAQTQDAKNIIETTVAKTLSAMPTADQKAPGEDVIEVETPSLQPTLAATTTLFPTETPMLPPTVTQTPDLTVPLVEVSVPTNCRTGPGKIFNQMSVLNVGKRVEVIGRSSVSNYWIVKNPGGSGTCWLWGQYATIIGQTANLPVWDTPPTPTPVISGTPTSSDVTLKVSVPTNCRMGPGLAYDKVSVLQPGKMVNVVARHATADFWVIENPIGDGTCWVWGKYATLSGSPESLPIQDIPLTQTGVTLKVSVDTNCRIGPGIPYDIVTILRIGNTVSVVGKHATTDFWVIDNPSGNGTCWVWGEYATVIGPTKNLPVWEVPPTPTPASVTLQVSVDTNCRTGPGIPYPIVTILRIGKKVEVIGRNSAGTYWVIQNPTGSGHCWVWGKYASLTGRTESLQIWDHPATPTPTP